MANINGVNPPAINDVDYVDKITNSFNAIDDHDHSSGKGLPIAAGGIANNAVTTATIANGAVTAPKLASDAVTTAKILDANVTYAKLSIAGSVVNADISASAAIAYSKLNLVGAIVNADINASAAIAVSKLAAVTASRALVSDGSGFIAPATTTATELGYVNGVTSAIQTQIDGKQPIDADLTALAALATSGLVARTGAGTVAARTITGTANQVSITNGDGVSGNPTIAITTDPIIPGTGSVTIPYGTTAQRSSPANGMIRGNSDSNSFEGYINGAWGSLGGSSSGVNYITNGSAEASTTGWATYLDAAAAIPVDGTGGSPTVTITRNTTNPLKAPAMFTLTKGASNCQGQGVSYDFTISNEDKAQVLTVQSSYLGSAAFAYNQATYASPSDVAIYLYDVTNAQIIYPSQSFLDGSGKVISQFQTNSNSTSYRLIFHIATTNASAWTWDFDSVSVGPAVVASGVPVSDWISYTPTITNGGTTSTNSGRYRRVGDSIELQVYTVYTGAGAASPVVYSLPSGLSIDTTKMSSVVTDGATVGNVMWFDTGTNEKAGGVLYRSTTTVSFAIDSNGTAVLNGSALANGDWIRFTALLPISGWSSNVAVSSDYGNRLIAFNGTNAAATTIGTGGSDVPFVTVTDTTGSFGGTSYTFPESGFYNVNYLLTSNSVTLTTAQRWAAALFLNGATQISTVRSNGVGVASQYSAAGSISRWFNAGDTIKVVGYSSVSVGLDPFANENYLTINKVQTPQTLAGGQVVAFRGQNSAGTSLTTSTTSVPLTTVFDTHGAYNGSTTWTCPEPGFYQLQGQLITQAASVAAGVYMRLLINVNGTAVVQVRQYGTAASDLLVVNGGTLVKLVAGDAITFQGGPETGTLSLDTTATNNFLTIAKVN
jgi:hypothetical protein